MTERFIKPTYKQLVDIAIIFNDGEIDIDQLAVMTSMTEFVLDRLYENGDVEVKCSKEKEIERDDKNRS